MVDEQRRVQFTIDTSKAKKELIDLRKAQEQLAISAAKGDKSFAEAAKSLKKLESQERDLLKTIRKFDPEFDKGTKQLREQARAARELDERLEELESQFSKTSQQVGSFGDIQSNLGAGRGLAAAAGFGGVDVGLGVVGEVVALGEELPRLKDSLKAAGTAVQVTTKSLGLGELAGNFQSLAPALGATGASVAALTVAALPLVAAIGGVALAMHNYNQAAEAQRKVIATTIEAQREVREAIAEGLTTEEAQEQLEQLKRSRESEVAEVHRLEGAYQSMENQLGLLSGAVKVFDGREEELFNTIESGRAKVDKYEADIRALENALANGSLASNDAAISEEELAKARVDATKAIDQAISQAGQRAQQSLNQSDQFTAQISDAYANRDKAQKRAAESAALEAEIESRKREEAAQEHQERLTDIQKQGQGRIAKLEQGFSDLANQQAEKLADVQTKADKDLAKLRRDYFADTQANYKDFYAETRKIESDTAKQRIRLIEDIQDSLADAERSNDVIAFLKAQRDGQKQLKRNAEDAQQSEQERTQAFIDAQNQQREAFNQRQTEILFKVAEEKQAVIASYDEKRAALALQIEEEKVAIQQRLEAERAAEQERLQRQAQADADTAAREALRKKQEEEDFQERIDAIAKQREEAQRAYEEEQRNIQNLNQLKQEANNLELRALQELSSGTQNLITLASQLKTAASSAGTSTSGSRFGSRSTFGSSNSGSRFGYGNLTSRRELSGSISSRKIVPFHDGGRAKFKGAQTEGFVFVKEGETILDTDHIGSPEAGTSAKTSEPLFLRHEGVIPAKGALPMPPPEQSLPLFSRYEKTIEAKPPVVINYSPKIDNSIGDIATASQVSDAINRSNEMTMKGLVETFTRLTS